MQKYLTFRYRVDQIAALVVLIIASPLLLIAVIMIKLDGGPIFFFQDRCGLAGRTFRVIKLRTMIVNADKYLDKNGMPTRKRITRVGEFLRRSSLDELPQLINIIKGDMAIIGPRPILPSMADHMTEREKQRFVVLPGVTGLAQVKGRNFLKWSRRFHFDCIYTRKAGPILDFYILTQTILQILLASNIAVDRNADLVDDVRTRETGSSSDR